jgi:hypothetical protein
LSLIVYVSEGRSAADLLRMTNAIKRLVALSGKDPTAQVQFELFREAVAREPSMRSHHRAAMLADDLEQFVIAAMSDPAFGLKQKPLGALLAVNQTTISRWINRPEAQGKARAQ